MPLTFGAASSDVAQLSLVTNAGLTGSAFLYTGWFYPTTLTAGRCLITPSGSNPSFQYSTKVGTTTSTLQLSSNTGTTAGLWTATADSTLFPSGITTNAWWFIAGLCSVITGPTVAWRMWIGNESISPTAMTITQTTAPAGVVGGGTLVFVGNDRSPAASPTSAFQGDIGQITWISCTTGVNTLLPIAAAGTISVDEELLIQQTYVQPVWLGQAFGRYPKDGVTGYDIGSSEMRLNPMFIRHGQSAGGLGITARSEITGTTATASLREHPRVCDISMPVRYSYVRR